VLGAYVLCQPLNPRDIGGGPASPLEALEVAEAWFAQTLRCSKDCPGCHICRDYYYEALQVMERTRHAG
jgi:hypothetical protein